MLSCRRSILLSLMLSPLSITALAQAPARMDAYIPMHIPEVARQENPYPRQIATVCVAKEISNDLLSTPSVGPQPSGHSNTSEQLRGKVEELEKVTGHSLTEACAKLMRGSSEFGALLEAKDVEQIYRGIVKNQEVVRLAKAVLELEELRGKLPDEPFPVGGLKSRMHITTDLPTQAIGAVPSLEEKIINGVADFVVNRAQQEAALYFQEKLPEYLRCGGELFTATCDLLDALKDTPWTMSAVSVQLRTSLRSDFRDLPERKLHSLHSKLGKAETSCTNTDKKAEAECVKKETEQFASNSRKIFALRLGVAAYKASRASRTTSDVFRGLSELENDCEEFKTNKAVKDACHQAETNFKRAGEVFKIIEGSRYRGGSNDTLNILISGLGAILKLADHETLPFAKGKEDLDFQAIAKNLNKIIAVVRLHDEIVEANNVVATMREAISPSAGAMGAADRLLAEKGARLRALSLAMESIKKLALAACPGKTSEAEGSVSCISTELNELANFDVLLTSIVNDDVSQILVELMRIARLRALDAPEDKSLFYASALVEVGSAKNAKEVTEVIERIASPAGSYRQKFKRDMFSVTALMGYSAGRESYSVAGGQTNGFNSLFAPVGIQHSWSTGKAAIGAYFSLIDVGPLVASRDRGNDVQKDSAVGLAQVLSPGAFLTVNWPRDSPAVFGFGAARTPKLIRTTSGEEVASTRVLGFVAIDMTLFGF